MKKKIETDDEIAAFAQEATKVFVQGRNTGELSFLELAIFFGIAFKCGQTGIYDEKDFEGDA